MLDLPCYFQIVERPRAPGCPLGRRGRNKFSYWPVCVACAVVLTFRRPLKGLTVVPLRGGDRREDLPFERKTPGGCSDSSYRRPPGFRGCESKRGDDRCAKGNKHCSYVFVDSNQITGGRKTHGDKSAKPRPPQRTLNDPFGKPKVYLAMSSLRDLCVSALNRISQTPANPRARSVSRLPKQPTCPPDIMVFPMQIEKVYEPQRFEPHWAQWWIDSGIFRASPENPGRAFSLV